MKKSLLGLLLIAGFNGTKAQSIRKDYREFTIQEQNDYVAAINALSAPGNTVIQNIAVAHADHFNTNIHTTTGGNGSQFLSWHRFFLAEVEQYIKTATPTSEYLTIPYWDWANDNDKNAATYWNNSFFKRTNFTNLSFTRSTMTSAFPASALAPALNTVMAYTNFLVVPESPVSNPDFSHKLEAGAHNAIHTYIGGTMGGSSSPLDPMFFLHHGMVDKLWQNWEDNLNGMQSVYSGSIGTTAIVHYMTPMYPFNVISNGLVDSRALTRPANAGSGRKLDIWYAFNKKVLLDGTNGAAFVCNDATKPYLYRYVAATATAAFDGVIYVGDVKRDASDNIVADNRGGFEVNSGVTCDFRAGAAILFSPGFEAKSGSIVDSKVITVANGFKTTEPVQTVDEANARTASNEPSPILHLLPNPFTGKTTLQYMLPNQQTVSLKLQDLSGKTVINILSEEVTQAGTYEVTVDGEDLPAQVYLAVLTTEYGIIAKRLVKE